MQTRKKIVIWRRVVLPLTPLLALCLLPFAQKQKASALVTVVEFSDFQCPYCKHAAGVVEQLRQSYGNNVKLVFKQMPLPMHQYAFKAAQASVCAREQGRFWEYHDRLFAASDLSGDALNRIAAEVGLNRDEFSQCLESPTSRAIVEQDMAEAERLGVSGTPTFFVNGKAVRGAATFAALKQEIDSAMTKRNHPLLRSSSTGDSPFVENTESPSSIRPQVSVSQNSAASTTTASGVMLSPASINFGYQLVGTTGSEVTETVTNSRTAPLMARERADSISGRVTTQTTRSRPPESEEREKHDLSGVTITLRSVPSGAVVATVLTDEDGEYEFARISNGTYTVIPQKANYVFTPASRSVTIKDGNVKKQDFTAIPTHSISGRATTNNGGASGTLPLFGVTLTLSGPASATATTDGNGNYTFAGLVTGNYTITPEYAFRVIGLPSGSLCGGAKFTPASRSVIVKGSNITGQDFSGFDVGAAINPLCPAGSFFNGNVCGAPPIPGCLDSDGDGFCDAWEAAGGIDLNGDGIIDPVHDLLLPGADPHNKDVYLEIDYMVLPDQGTACSTNANCNQGQNCTLNICRGHSHQPHPEAVQAVVDAFARQGITLHVDPVHDAIPETPVITPDPLDATCSGPPPAAVNFYDLKALYSDPKRKIAYHYAIFGHYNTCGSGAACSLCVPSVSFGGGGRSELPGNDLIVSTGAFFDAGITPTVENEAGLLMHELGHNLGLRHGGAADFPIFKPNFLSVVNDNFTYLGIPVAATPGSVVPMACTTNADCPSGAICAMSSDTCTRIDYSGTALPALDELHLDERAGIAVWTNDITTYNCPDFTPRLGAGTGPIDWNCNGNATDTGVVVDINGDGSPPTITFPTILTGHADWPNLLFKFQCTAGGSANAPTPGRFFQEPGLSMEEARKRHVLFPPRAAQIELMPGVPVGSKTISLSSSGVISVAVFGADRFDVKDIDQTSLKFSGASPLRVEIRDVNGDGKHDLLLFFDIASLKLSRGISTVTVSGWLKNSQIISGEATINVSGR